MLYFIVNESSRTGKAAKIWEQVQKHLAGSGIDYMAYTTEYVGHATILAREISGKDDEDIGLVVLGGDGTMNEVINGLDFNQVRFGMIPTGSGNDFGRGLGFPKDPLQNLEVILANYKKGKDCYHAVDLGLVSWNDCISPRYFGISSGVGMDAIVCKKALTSRLKKVLNALHIGKLTYILITVHTLFSMKTTSADVSLSFNDSIPSCGHIPPSQVHMDKLIFSAAMNLKAEGGGVPMAPKQFGESNQLVLTSAFGIPKWRTFLELPILTAGKHEKLKGFSLYSFEKADIHLQDPMVLHADGEYLGEPTDIHYECQKNLLKSLNFKA